MILTVKIQDAIVNLINPRRTFRLDSQLSNRVSTARFEIEGEEAWATPSLACGTAIAAFGGRIKPHPKQTVKIVSATDNYFSGEIASVDEGKIGVKRTYLILAQDFNIRLHSILIDEIYTSKMEKEIIDDLFDTYWPEIDTDTYVS